MIDSYFLGQSNIPSQAQDRDEVRQGHREQRLRSVGHEEVPWHEQLELAEEERNLSNFFEQFTTSRWRKRLIYQTLSNYLVALRGARMRF